jgi:hypothetical protein
MTEKASTEQERTLVGTIAGRHPDTVRRYIQGLSVTETTQQAIEGACYDLDYGHIVLERLRALAAKGGQP